jgi:3'-phosphoadenosine 5'-phosphosulfate sulfotransferase (PAPS reductase)/FAD synthetase
MNTKERYKQLELMKALPLDVKIGKSKLRIREALALEDMYISYSGGKDSTVLKHLVQSVKADIPSVFVNTGLEYRSLREHATKNADTTVRPKMNFKEVLIKYGYPIISKMQSRYIEDVRNPNVCDKIKDIRINGSEKGYYKISEKWKYLLKADFKISNKCCYHMKKSPMSIYGKNGSCPFIGTMTEESNKRKTQWIEHGCNMVDSKKFKSMPMSFWTVQDVLEYLERYDLEIPSVYGDIIKVDGEYKTTGVNRTGCVFCGYGAHMEKEGEKRFVDLKIRDKQLYDYVIGGGEYKELKDGKKWWVPNNKGLGFGHVLDVYDVEY